jgi:hypothetical protein
VAHPIGQPNAGAENDGLDMSIEAAGFDQVWLVNARGAGR